MIGNESLIMEIRALDKREKGKELNKYYCFRSDPYICIDNMPYIVMFMK